MDQLRQECQGTVTKAFGHRLKQPVWLRRLHFVANRVQHASCFLHGCARTGVSFRQEVGKHPDALSTGLESHLRCPTLRRGSRRRPQGTRHAAADDVEYGCGVAHGPSEDAFGNRRRDDV
jgi:hypothetical protein